MQTLTAFPSCSFFVRVGVDQKTVKNIFDDYVERLRNEVVYETPRILGIDELKIVGQYRTMITNVEKLSLFDMLPTRNKADLLVYFDRLPCLVRARQPRQG